MNRLAFHFLRSDWTAHGGFPVKVGEVYRVEPPIVPCERGLHASTRAIDSLSYAQGPIVTLVECRGEIVEHGDPVDKFACSERIALWGYDATEELRYFSRWCALEVLHLWPDAPAIVREYLETGDESIRAAAWDAASDAARDATWAAASDAARDAAWDAARDAASDAARAAAWAAARAAAWAAARDAARDATWAAARAAAWDAASDAARDATWAAASDAARDAAWDAARDAFISDANHMLESLLLDGAVAMGLL